MNLTKCFAAALCLTAMTASAAYVKTNAFEGEATVDWFVGDGETLTTRTVANDAVNGRGDYSGGRPLADAGNTGVLQLDTEGNVWTNAVSPAYDYTGASVFVDMLVKFVPSEELPTIGTEVKLAVAVQQGTPNVFAFSVIDQDDFLTNEWVVTSGEIDTNAWTRLTIEMYDDSGYAFVNIKTNGALVNASPYQVQDALFTLNAIGFQGTGFIDEVVVRDDDPFATGGVLITLSFASGIQSVFVGATEKFTTETVPSGTDLIITAAQWKEIASVDGVSTAWVSGGLTESSGTVTVTSTTNATVTITAQTETSTAMTSGSGTSFDGAAPMDKVATWALANGVTTLTSGIYPNYLFNIDDAAPVPALKITSIAVSGSTVTVSVTADGTNLTTLNGTLKLKSYATLGGTPTIHNISFTGGPATVQIVQNIGTDKFVRATVE